MDLLQWHNTFQEELHHLYSPEEIRDFFKRLLMAFLGWDPTVLALDPHRVFSTAAAAQMEKALTDLRAQRPLQYIIGHTQFMSLSVAVSPDTLIPRPETEELVSWVLESAPPATRSLMDIGTGSGCIALALKYYQPSWQINALDISEKALTVAQRNSQKLDLEINFQQMDIETAIGNDTFDCIVANPPYVTQAEKTQMRDNVLKYEPHSALFVPDSNPLRYYKAIFRFADNALAAQGKIYFEINPLFAEAMVDLAVTHGFKNYEFKTDIFGKKRMLSAQR